MTVWRYVAADLLTDRTIAAVELSGVTAEHRIIIPGAFKATAAVPNGDVAALLRRCLPDPATGVPTSVVHMYADADLWGSYILWRHKASTDARGRVKVELQGASLDSWLYRRLVDVDLTFDGVDQVDIARALIEQAQQGWAPYTDAANLGILMLSGTSGVTRDRLYLRSEATSAGQRIEELASAADGFESRIITYTDPAAGGRVRLWVWGYPTLGEPVEVLHRYTMPGDLLEVTEDVDLTAGGTAFHARGDTDQADLTDRSQPVMTAAPWLRTDMIGAGWAWIDHVTDHQGVTVPSTLDAYAQWYAATRGGAVRMVQAKVRLPDDPGRAGWFRPTRLGDRVGLVAVNDWWPVGADGVPTFRRSPRVVGLAVTPADRGEGVDVAELVLADDGAAAPLIQAEE